MIGDPSRLLRVSDLNWGRLTSWRTLLASFWDVPDYRPLLDEIDRVEVAYDPPDVAPDEVAPKALLVAGWLASRLGWEVVGKRVRGDGGVIECDLTSGDRVITLSLIREENGQNDSMISSVALSAKKGKADFYVALRAGGTKLQTEARIGTQRSVGRVLGYEMRSAADRLSRELAFLSRDAVYEEAVTRAAQLVEAIPKLKKV
jgi:glucose-6-phosphate dehydrogenase assembly protein OpcA